MVEAQTDDEGSFAETSQDVRQETLDYLSLAGMTPEGVVDQYPVDRTRSIFELIDERKWVISTDGSENLHLVQATLSLKVSRT